MGDLKAVWKADLRIGACVLCGRLQGCMGGLKAIWKLEG